MSHILNVIVKDQKELKKYEVSDSFVIEAEKIGTLLEEYLKDISGVRYLVMFKDVDDYACSCEFAFYTNDEKQTLTLHFPEKYIKDIKLLFDKFFNDSPGHCLVIYLESNRIVTFPDEIFPVKVNIDYIMGLHDFWERYNEGKIVENTLYVIGDKF